MNEDHLDNETSVSVDLTETGVTASAKSRFVAALDRLGGNFLELMNSPMEHKSKLKRAKTAAEVQVIEAVVQHGIEHMKRNPAFAQHVAEKHFEGMFRRQDNKDGVLKHAVEDMRHDPLTTAEAEAGGPELDAPFLDRFERYAEEASTEQLRQKWGRVLSAEIRKPGTFSSKTMRVVDEIDAATAQLFERLCESRLANVLPKCLVGEISFSEEAALVSAGLLVAPGMEGQIRKFIQSTGPSGLPFWLLNLGEYGIAIPKSTVFPTGQLFPFGNDVPTLIVQGNKEPALPIYVLTDVGTAVAEILPNKREVAFLTVVAKIKEYLPSSEISELEVDVAAQVYRVRGRPLP